MNTQTKNLPPLPEPSSYGSWTACPKCAEYPAAIFSSDQMRKYALEAIRASATSAPEQPADKTIDSILDGIDRWEGDADIGWWETSDGVAFGTQKLAEIKAFFATITQPVQPAHDIALQELTCLIRHHTDPEAFQEIRSALNAFANRAQPEQPATPVAQAVGEGFFLPDGSFTGSASATFSHLRPTPEDAAAGCTIRPLYTHPSKDVDSRDAERYRFLREKVWNDAEFCVVAYPKQAVKLGYGCPSHGQLDKMIDAALQAKDAPP